MSTVPSAPEGISTERKPAKAAVAGLVPWAESGTSTTSRASPRAESALRIINMPVSSPWAPAAGCSVTPGMPVIVLSASSSSHTKRSAP